METDAERLLHLHACVVYVCMFVCMYLINTTYCCCLLLLVKLLTLTAQVFPLAVLLHKCVWLVVSSHKTKSPKNALFTKNKHGKQVNLIASAYTRMCVCVFVCACDCTYVV